MRVGLGDVARRLRFPRWPEGSGGGGSAGPSSEHFPPTKTTSQALEFTNVGVSSSSRIRLQAYLQPVPGRLGIALRRPGGRLHATALENGTMGVMDRLGLRPPVAERPRVKGEAIASARPQMAPRIFSACAHCPIDSRLRIVVASHPEVVARDT